MGATGKRVMCKINLIHKNEVIYAKILTMVNSERVTDDFFSSIFSIFFKFSIKKKKSMCFAYGAECNGFCKSEPLLPGKVIHDDDAYYGLAFTLILFL